MGNVCEIENIKELKQKNKMLEEKISILEKQVRIKEYIPPPNTLDFYDVIVNIQSIKDIIKGWEVKVNKNKKYDELIRDNVLKIGVIGNSNKGKSFILSKISKRDLPSGTSIKTEGLSIKYPELWEIYKNKRIVLLDSAGLETPVLNDKNDKFQQVDEKEIKNISQNSNLPNLGYDNFKEKSREKIITELFLQNYILHNSDILIVVVGQLTYTEQKLLNKIKIDMKRAKLNKTLYVIHNLITFTTKKQIEDYIQNTLLNCSTFQLKEQMKIEINDSNEAGVSFYEQNNDQKIFHLIFANDYSEAGKYYNEYTIKFLEDSFKSYPYIGNFDIIKTLKERFKKISKEIIENIEENEISFDESKKDIIKLVKPEKIVLKECFIDELGFKNLKANGFEPSYNYYKKNDQIIVKVEIPGNCTLKSNIYYIGEYVIIKLDGIKEKDKEPMENNDIIFNNRESGQFSLEIPLRYEEYMIKNEQPKIVNKNGIFILSYQLDKNIQNRVFKQPEEDKI